MSVFLFTQAYFIYSVPIIVGLALCLLESLYLLRGNQLLGLLETPAISNQSVVTSLHQAIPLTLRLHEVSVVFWLLVFCIAFGAAGIIAQSMYFVLYKAYISQLILFPLTLTIATLCTVISVKQIAPYLREYNRLYQVENFTGYIATIIDHGEFLGEKVSATLIDHSNRVKTISVKALENNERFISGDKVVLVQQENDSWLATRIKSSVERLHHPHSKPSH